MCCLNYFTILYLTLLITINYVIMAIAIKNIPLLKEDVAVAFDSKAEAAIAKKSTIKFSKQLAVSAKILKKAKI